MVDHRDKHPRVSDPVVRMPDDVERMADRTQFVVNSDLLQEKWQALEDLTNPLIPFDYGSDENLTFPLTSLFEQFKGLSVIPHHDIFATYRGGQLFGHIDLHSEVAGKRNSFLAGLKAAHSLDAFIESMYVAYQLPTKCAFWHGLYGRNYALLFDYDRLFHFPPKCCPFTASQVDLAEVREKVDRPLGIRVCKRREKYYISCLAVYAGGSIADRTVVIAGDKVSRLTHPSDVVYRSPNIMTY